MEVVKKLEHCFYTFLYRLIFSEKYHIVLLGAVSKLMSTPVFTNFYSVEHNCPEKC